MKHSRTALRLLFLSTFLLAGSLLRAQSSPAYQPARFTDPERLQKIRAALPVVERIYADYFAAQGFPGMAFGIMADGQLLHAGGFGYTDLSQQVPVTTSSVFRIASMTKSFTALAILKLRDAGRLKLDDPAHLYIPQMKGANYLTADAAPITVRQLMTHAAGFPEDNPWGDRQLADTDAELLQLLERGVSFSHAPGLAYEYSNLGFALLGQIINRVSGQPYQQYIREAVLKPLGMSATYWDYRQVQADRLAKGYRRQQGRWVEEPLLPDGSYGAMGGLMTSMEDFGRYMALHLSAWPPRGGAEHPVLARSSLREMQQPWNFAALNAGFRFPDGRSCPTAAAYGYGLRWVRDCDQRVWVGHSGGLPGFGSNWTIFPDYGIGVACFVNGTYAPTSTLNLRVLDTLIHLAGLQPRALTPSPVLEQRKDELVKLLPHWRNAAQSGLFAENFFPDRPVEERRKESARHFQRIGRVVRVHPLLPENNLRGTFLIEGEKGSMEVFFTLTPEPRPLIQELSIR